MMMSNWSDTDSYFHSQQRKMDATKRLDHAIAMIQEDADRLQSHSLLSLLEALQAIRVIVTEGK
jgi:hypothetical protein